MGILALGLTVLIVINIVLWIEIRRISSEMQEIAKDMMDRLANLEDKHVDEKR